MSGEKIAQVLRTTCNGSILAIKASNLTGDGGNSVQVNCGKYVFGYLHIFRNWSTKELLEGVLGDGGFILKRVSQVTAIGSGKVATCDIIFTPTKKALIAATCPLSGSLIHGSTKYQLTSKILAGEAFAPKGNSGGVKAHVHVYMRDGGVTRNPLSLITNAAPIYTVTGLNQTFSNAPPSTFVISVDYGKNDGQDLDRIEFNGNVQYAFGGAFGSALAPQALTANIFLGSDCRLSYPAVCPDPAPNDGTKKIVRFALPNPLDCKDPTYTGELKLVSADGIEQKETITLKFSPSPMGGVLHSAIYAGSIYYMLPASSWISAEITATKMGGHLATVGTAAENKFILDTFSPIAFGLGGSGPISLWIGLNDEASEGQFVWSSGASSAYSNWLTGQPQGTVDDEDYVGILVANYGEPGKWHDVVADTRFKDVAYGIVEVPCTSPIEQ